MATGGAEMVDMDKVLKESHVLTSEEVIQRRTRRLEQLMKVYRAQYWGLLEEMRSKYRRFYLRHGKSGWRWDNEDGVGVSRSEQSHGEQAAAAGTAAGGGGGGGGRELNSNSAAGEMKEPHAPEKPGNEMRCGAQGCNNKPLLLSVYCYAHVLLEPRQRLYRPCSYVVRRSSGKCATILCSKPVLQAVSPSLCPAHFEQTQKQSARSLRKAGILLPPGMFTKTAPKLHYFVAEYVKAIQAKRRALRAAEMRSEKTDTAKKETISRPLEGLAMVPGGFKHDHKKEKAEQAIDTTEGHK